VYIITSTACAGIGIRNLFFAMSRINEMQSVMPGDERVTSIKQPRIHPVRPRHELRMATLFDNPAILDHANTIHTPNSGEAVSNQNRSPPLHEPLESLLKDALRFGKKNRRVLEHCPSYCNSLLLPARQLHPSLPDCRLVPLRQLAHKPVNVSRLRRLDQFLLCCAAMFSIMLAANSTGSCCTRPIFSRRDFRFSRRMSLPSIMTLPAVGS
ncbi:hypothetical protein ACMD2_03954, partial [Ananas comosus]